MGYISLTKTIQMRNKSYTIVCLVIALAMTIVAHGQMISTYVGTGTQGYFGDGGAATDATLYNPSDVALDPAGNLYIADFYNNVVRKVSTAGIITTIAGTGMGSGSAGGGSFGGDGGPATDALLNGPYAIAVDAAGNVLFADGYNHNVRKISPAGIITNFAGNHTAAYSGDGGQATAAALNNPVGLAIDKVGNVYIADDHNHVVRRVTPTGIISTYAGNDTVGYSGDGSAATTARLNNPIGLAIDSSGNLFIADDVNNNIRKVSPAGIISTYVGVTDTGHGYTGDGGPATAARLSLPRHIACDRAGNLYISDLFNDVIRMVSASGSHTITTFAGIGTYGYSGDGGAATAAEFQSVNGVAIDTGGRVFIADVGNAMIRMVGPWTTAVNTVASKGTMGIQITPNPLHNGNCVVNLTTYIYETVDIVITDATGKTVYAAPLTTNKPTALKLNVPAGIYWLTATAGKERTTSSIILQ